MFKRLLPVLVAITVVAAACGGGTEETVTADDTSGADTTEVADTETTTAPETTEAPADTESSETETTTPDTTEASAEPAVVDGMTIFEANCARCHGSDGGGRTGPKLLGIADKDPDKTKTLGLVTDGGQRMPSFGDKLTAEEITAVIDFVHEAFPAATE